MSISKRKSFGLFLCGSLALTSLMRPVFANEPLPSSCKVVMDEKAKEKYMLKRVVNLHGTGYKFTKESTQFFIDQRAKFRTLIGKAQSQLIEMDTSIKRVAEAMMLETFAYTYGPPGAAKSYLADMFLSIPQEEELTGLVKESYYRLQFNENLSDVPIRGYRDKEGTLFTKETALHSKYLKLDEIDKANPSSIAATLDIINQGERVAQHGTETIPADARAGVITSNMTIYEFLESFAAQIREPTAKAFLDRNPFKVYIHNYPANEAKIVDLLKLGRSSSIEKGHKLLFSNQGKTAVQKDGIDFSWLGALAYTLFHFDDSMLTFEKDVVHDLRKKINARRLTDQQRRLEEGASVSGGYEPTTIFSARNIKTNFTDTIAVSLFYDLLVLPEDVLPSSAFVSMLEKGVKVTPESAWRIQDTVLTATAASPKLAVEDVGGKSKLKLVYSDELPKLKEGAADVREVRLLDDFQKDQDTFAGIFEEHLEKVQETNKSVSAIEADYLDILGGSGAKKKKIRNLEEWLMQVAQ